MLRQRLAKLTGCHFYTSLAFVLVYMIVNRECRTFSAFYDFILSTINVLRQKCVINLWTLLSVNLVKKKKRRHETITVYCESGESYLKIRQGLSFAHLLFLCHVTRVVVYFSRLFSSSYFCNASCPSHENGKPLESDASWILFTPDFSRKFIEAGIHMTVTLG